MNVIRVIVLLFLASRAMATDLIYSDITASSPSGQYKVVATSPDNTGKPKRPRRAFQSSFTYTCTDTGTNKVLWVRKQPMNKPLNPGDTFASPAEPSPSGIRVSDQGWTVIVGGGDELICVDVQGQDRAKTSLLHSAFTEEERKTYVSRTTAGPRWAAHSMWYFLEVNGRHYFVVRPWWGTRKIMNLDAGMLTAGGRLPEPAPIAAAADAYERRTILAELKLAGEKQQQRGAKDRSESVAGSARAAHLAGLLKITEAVPLLRTLEESAYSGSSTVSTIGYGEAFDGEVDPHSYSTYRIRQAAQLSLRRLGEVPRAFPAHVFEQRYRRSSKDRDYTPPPLTAPRHTRVAEIKTGMTAEQVLALIGAPDFTPGQTWEYDMDATPGYSLTLKWDDRRVTAVEKGPVLWKDGLTRDFSLIR